MYIIRTGVVACVWACACMRIRMYTRRELNKHDMTMMKGDYNGETDRYIMQ